MLQKKISVLYAADIEDSIPEHIVSKRAEQGQFIVQYEVITQVAASALK